MRTDLHLLHAALQLFAENGFAETSMRDIATRAGVSPGLAYKYHPSKEALAMALYARLAEQFEARAPDLPKGSVTSRFAAAMAIKLSIITPHRSALRALAARAIDPTDRLGVLGPRASAVRSRDSGVFRLVVDGARDRPSARDCPRLARILYGAHLAVIGVWTQDTEPDNPKSTGVIELIGTALGLLPLVGMLPGGAGMLDRIDGLFGQELGMMLSADEQGVVEAILQRIFQRRRLFDGSGWPASDAALALHRAPIEAAVAAKRPVQLVLPAFPAKSPNPAKTLGPLPDLAEVLALRNLGSLCTEITDAYAPGATLIIASDGHVLADLVEVCDADVTAYQSGIRHILEEEGLTQITLFDLGDLYGDLAPDTARSTLIVRYAKPLEAVQQRAEDHGRHKAMFNGIHRVLLEDAAVDQDTTVDQDTKARAWQIVRRSDAWAALVAEAFPDALRLSIHPQPEVSEKIGIHLMPTQDVWLTPWHGTAVLGDEGARLMKRAEAMTLGATNEGDHLLLP